MFGVNKKREEKERELEQALSSKQEEADQYAQKLTEAKGSMQAAWQEAESGFAAMEEGQKELEEELRGFAKSVGQADSIARQQDEKLKGLKRQAGKLAKDAEKTEGGSKKSLEKIRRQQKEIEEIFSQYGKVISPGEAIQPAVEGIRQEIGQMKEQVAGLDDLGKQMEMHALQAAIEAGRLGEPGRGFVEAAEEVRVLSGQYSWAAAFLTDKMGRILTRLEEAEAQMGQMAQVLERQNTRLEKSVVEISGCVEAVEAPDASWVSVQIKELAEGLEKTGELGKEAAKEYSQAAEGLKKTGKEYLQGQRKVLRDMKGKIKEKLDERAF